MDSNSPPVLPRGPEMSAPGSQSSRIPVTMSIIMILLKITPRGRKFPGKMPDAVARGRDTPGSECHLPRVTQPTNGRI